MMTIRAVLLISAWCVLAGTLLPAPAMARRFTQSPAQAPAASEAASKVQGMARDAVGAKTSDGATTGDGDVAPGKRPKGSGDETADAKAKGDKAANNSESSAASGSADRVANAPAAANAPA